jgi:outer membrane murein-binding lipoprotein Lpp
MGKKSKGSKSQGKGTGKTDGTSTALQELQTQVNTLSLAEAMRAVKMANQSLNQLKEQQQKAIKETQRAKEEIISTASYFFLLFGEGVSRSLQANRQ